MSFASNIRRQIMAHRIDVKNINVPAGWSVSQSKSNVSQACISRPDGCSVTVDFISNTFTAGSGGIGPAIGKIKEYSDDSAGRRELVQTAIGWLDSI